jgi:hypothetical protein
MPVGKMTINKMTVDKMPLDEMPRCPQFLTKTRKSFKDEEIDRLTKTLKQNIQIPIDLDSKISTKFLSLIGIEHRPILLPLT